MKQFLSPLTVSAVVFSILGALFFYNALYFASQSGKDFFGMLVSILLVVGCASFAFAYFWEKAVVKKHKSSHFSIVMTIILVLILFCPAVIRIGGEPLLLKIYIFLGERIYNMFGYNIFYLDYSGFTLLYLGISALFFLLVFDTAVLKVIEKRSSRSSKK